MAEGGGGGGGKSRPDVIPSIVISRKPQSNEASDGNGKQNGAGSNKRSRARRGPSSGGNGGGGPRTGRSHDFTNRTRVRTAYNDNIREFRSGSDFSQSNSSEDCRISTCLRRLAREEDEDKFFALCRNLKDALPLPDNAVYIRRFLDMILDSLLDNICNGPNYSCRAEAARTLGNVGFVLDKELKKYITWVFAKCEAESKEENKVLILSAVREFAELDRSSPKAHDCAVQIITQIVKMLEFSEDKEVFIASVELLLILVGSYPECFAGKQFEDSADVVLGWQLDITQPVAVTECALRFILQSAPFWVAEESFAVSMLNQVLEDAILYAQNVDPPEKGKSFEERVIKLTRLLAVFGAIFKGVACHLKESESPEVAWPFFDKFLEQVATTMTFVFNEWSLVTNEEKRETSDADTSSVTSETSMMTLFAELIVEGNRTAGMLLDFVSLNNDDTVETIRSYLYTQMYGLNDSRPSAVRSLFKFVVKVIDLISKNAKFSWNFVDGLLAPKSIFLENRLRPGVVNSARQLYLWLLSHESSVIQSYAHIIGDLDAAMRTIDPQLEPLIFDVPNLHASTVYDLSEVEGVLLFLLRVLYELFAVAEDGPITTLFRLKPSIFEILAIRMPKVIDPTKWPSIYEAYVSLLRFYCTRHRYFTVLTSVINCSQPQESLSNELALVDSPNLTECSMTRTAISDGFNVVLKLLQSQLSLSLASNNKNLIMEWTTEVLDLLQSNPEFALTAPPETAAVLIYKLCVCAWDFRTKAARSGVSCLLTLFPYYSHVIWHSHLMSSIIDLSFYFLNSAHEYIRREYHHLMCLLPSLIVTFTLHNKYFGAQFTFSALISWLYLEMSLYRTGELTSNFFETCMLFLLNGTAPEECLRWLRDMILRCWTSKDIANELSREVFHSNSLTIEWIAFQMALYCVSNRFRTFLGKPLNTFNAIDEAVRDLAKEAKAGVNLSNKAVTVVRVRLLVQFLEHLEKLMYYSTEGTATAFNLDVSAVRSFFVTNRASCYEWFARVRHCLITVCFHCGLSAAVVRHGYSLLQSLLDHHATQTPEFESALLHVSQALTTLGEPDSVLGLYIWSRDTAGVKSPALLPMVAMAGRHYEQAAEEFEELVAEVSAQRESLERGDTSPQIVLSDLARSVITDLLTECYLATNSWDELAAWKTKEIDFLSNENGGTTRKYKYLTLNFAESLSLFDRGETAAAAELLEWSGEESETLFSSDRLHWDLPNMICEADFVLKNIIVKKTGRIAYSLNALEKCGQAQTLGESILEVVIKDSPSELAASACLLKYTAHSMINRSNSAVSSIYNDNYWWKISIKSPEAERAAWWGHALDQAHNKSTEQNQALKDFLLKSATVSRKLGNFKTATRNILKNMKEITDFGLTSASQLTEKVIELSEVQLANAPALIELSKILLPEDKQMTVKLLSKVAFSLQGRPENIARSTESSAFLALAKIFSENFSDHPKFLNDHMIWSLIDCNHQRVMSDSLKDFDDFFSEVKDIVDEEFLVRELLCGALIALPESAKAWGALASWCYENGGKMSAKTKGEDLPWLEGFDGGRDVVSALADYHSLGINVDTTSSETVEQQVRETDGVLSKEQIEELIASWKRIHSRVFSLFRLAVRSYFKFLSLTPYSDSVVEASELTVTSPFGSSRESRVKNFAPPRSTRDDRNIITATLRLLRLIAKHSSELKESIEEGLANTPTAPWIAIVPQLFSRLNHPDSYVRTMVEELLIKIGNDAPHIIIFPAVVGSTSTPTTKLISIMKSYPRNKNEDFDDSSDTGLKEKDFYGKAEEDDDDEDEDDDEEEDEENEMHRDETDYRSEMLENSFHKILASLSGYYSEGISQVKMMVLELRRITLLWDELWLGTLMQHQPDINRRCQQLSLEILATESNTNLSQTVKDDLVVVKYHAILKPLLFVFEQLHSITSVSPETPHEKKFQQLYSKDIDKVLKILREPDNPRVVEPVVKAICGLVKSLQDRTYPKQPGAGVGGGMGGGGIRAQYSLNDVSPALAKLSSSQIAMPGVVTSSPPRIQRIDPSIGVLHTKTKPKKLIFYGSDGRKYTYLFKGLEDLHLDERIMQFLSIANTMLKEPHLKAHHYSVVPLGPRSGLISWVDNVTPIFTLYKKWQQRECQNDSEGGALKRPSELFYANLGPILKKAGISSIDLQQRNKWPLWAVKKCLMELTQSTPTYLLSNPNAAKWWTVTKVYASSLAVMSMIGYIIGLGDRHLDNVLVNLRTGEVVHIDYNVCFEKGKTLRVPEKVPFRLTPNLRAALGVTGIEGTYRQTCELVLRVLKEGQETLLTLLEAFVYDPLIDWTPLNEGGYTGAVYGGGRELTSETKRSKKALDKEVTYSMLKVRITESKHQWMENKKVLLIELDQLTERMRSWLEEDDKILKLQETLHERYTQLALLKEAEGQPQHSLYTLPQRYAQHLQAHAAKQSTLARLKSTALDSEELLNQFQAVLSWLSGNEPAKLLSDVKILSDKFGVCRVFDLVKEFLSNAGQGHMVKQCVMSERELTGLCLEQAELSGALLDKLLQYWEVASQYPSSCLLKHRTALYKRWADMLLTDLSPEVCQEVRKEMEQELNISEDTMRQVGMFNAGLQRHLADVASNFKRLMDRSAELLRVDGAQLESHNWLSDIKITGMQGPTDKTLVAVVLTALCTLNKKFLKIESQANSAGDSLLNLTSREGDWFLLDMCSISGTILRLAQFLPSILMTESPESGSESQISIAIKCIHHSYAQFKGLQDMYYNFTGVILAESMKIIYCEDPTVMTMLNRLESVISSVNIPLTELVSQLQLHLRFTVMGMQSPHGLCMTTVETLRLGYDTLFKRQMAMPEIPNAHEVLGIEPQSRGDLLLMAFSGLFVNLDHTREPLVTHLKSLVVPVEWKMVDQIAESLSHYTAPINEDQPRTVLDAIFFVKRLVTMLDVLRMLRCDAAGFRGSSLNAKGGPQVPHDIETLSKPVKRYIADYISYQMLGVSALPAAVLVCRVLDSQGLDVTGQVQKKDIGALCRVPLDDLCKKLADRLGGIRSQEMRKASGVVSQAEAVGRQSEAQERIERQMSNATALLQRYQSSLQAHMWLHDHILVNPITHSGQYQHFARASFLTQTRELIESMRALHVKMNEAVGRQNVLIASIDQRLKWAIGANPALTDIMKAFEDVVAEHRQRFDEQRLMAVTASQMASAALALETLRTSTNEAKTHDSRLAMLVQECEETYFLLKNTPAGLNPTEEGLLNLITPKKEIDQEWINKAEQLVSASVKKFKSELEPQQLEMFAVEDCVKTKASYIRGTMSKHNRIISDIKSLLKNITKYEDSELSENLKNYLCRYKNFTDSLNSVTRSLTVLNQLNRVTITSCLQEVRELIDSADGIFSELLELSFASSAAHQQPPVHAQTTSHSHPVKVRPPAPIQGSPLGLEKNGYAVSVWRRVKFKLEGRDPDPGIRSSVSQQVDWTIAEATNVDNLAVLYEGWTPWV